MCVLCGPPITTNGTALEFSLSEIPHRFVVMPPAPKKPPKPLSIQVLHRRQKGSTIVTKSPRNVSDGVVAFR